MVGSIPTCCTTNRRCAKIKETYPEKYFREWLEKDGFVQDIDFKTQYPIGTYFVDFFFPKSNLCVEIDGERFHKRDDIRELKRENFIKLNHSLIRFETRPLVKGKFKAEIDNIIDTERKLK